MSIIIEKINPPFSPCTVIYAAVFVRNWRFELAKGTGEGFGGGFFIGGWFGGRYCWLGGLRQCGRATIWPLEARLAGGAGPLGKEENPRSYQGRPRLKHYRSSSLRESSIVRVTLRTGH